MNIWSSHLAPAHQSGATQANIYCELQQNPPSIYQSQGSDTDSISQFPFNFS
jgi:hypothetical protein